ncbi:MAG: urease accessory protein UreF [Acidimicrobiia bacterium]
MTRLGLLMLADGRFPSGAHAHSGGVEAAVRDGRVRDHATLATFVDGRLRTVGLTDAAFVAATVRIITNTPPDAWSMHLAELDAEANARILAAPLRVASRRLGRQVVRAAAACWPDNALLTVFESFPDGLHQNVAFGVAALAAGVDSCDGAYVSLYNAVTMTSSAGVRLLGLDPLAVTAMTAGFEPLIEQLASEADDIAVRCSLNLCDLPALNGPLVEIAAMHHVHRDGRLFAT